MYNSQTAKATANRSAEREASVLTTMTEPKSGRSRQAARTSDSPRQIESLKSDLSVSQELPNDLVEQTVIDSHRKEERVGEQDNSQWNGHHVNTRDCVQQAAAGVEPQHIAPVDGKLTAATPPCETLSPVQQFDVYTVITRRQKRQLRQRHKAQSVQQCSR
jgi:hypothetical protein